MTFIRIFLRSLPTLIFAFIMAIAVWVTAVTAQDPNEQNIYPRAVPVEIIGQDPSLVLVDDELRQITISINAPGSIWRRLRTEQNLVRATADLSELGPGNHNVEVQPTINVRPAEVISIAPQFINVTLEPLATRNVPIRLVREGEPAIGFQAEDPRVSPERVTISGPESQVTRIQEVRATLNLGNAHDNIQASLTLIPLDANEDVVRTVSLSPEKVNVVQPITQQGGYRNVVVKVVTEGTIAHGYRLSNISVSPPAITVFSADPLRVNNLPGYIETLPVNLEGANDDLDISVPLDLPEGIEVVGDESVQVQVGIAAIESSITLSNQMVEIIGLSQDVEARVSPVTIDIILFGPIPILDTLTTEDVRVLVDLTGYAPGTYQETPRVEVRLADIQVVSIIPGVLEVEIDVAPTPTTAP
jgi:YbbR domain-containing protein